MKQLDTVLILPDARLQKRVLNMGIIQAIQNYYNQKTVKTSVARFNSAIEKEDIVYTNFKELIMYIQNAHFIIAADSLPIHLAQLLNKPHFMLFPNGHPRNFMTPYALEYNSYGEFSNFKLPV
jgi:ADP-heptose:LPS heptosyltransferase